MRIVYWSGDDYGGNKFSSIGAGWLDGLSLYADLQRSDHHGY